MLQWKKQKGAYSRDDSLYSEKDGSVYLELNHISFSYPGCSKPALTDINLSFRQEGITAVIGPNGCGKTTLTKVMCGILRPGSGEVRLQGQCLKEFRLAQVGRRIGYVFQNPGQQLFCSTVEEEIGFGLTNRGEEPALVKEKVDFYLNYFELSPHRKAFPLHLSYGEKQRVAIAAVLAGEPGFLILDEPTVGLDNFRKSLLLKILRKVAELARGVVFVSHDAGFIDQAAERVITLENGQVQCDSMRR